MWEDVKIDWVNSNVPTALDFNRIEEDTEYLRKLLG